MTITAPDAPTLPSLNDPANFNTRALALFSWLVTEYIPWLETLAGVTDDGEINGTPIGQKAAAAGKFTTLLADSLGGVAVQSSATDATAGKLMKVGAFGLGETVELYGADSLQSRQLPTGFYTYSAASVAGAPENVAYAHNLQVIHSELANRRTYIAARATGSVSSARMWWGVGTGTDPIAWTPMAMGGFTVGAVSQSGGLPTGAVIERGSNTNGRYVRFADGTQICTHRKNALTTGAETWTFPADFIEAPQCSFLPISATAHTVTADPPSSTTTYVEFNCFDTTGARQAKSCHLTATGRWF
ncbi:hypothetical protein KUV61_04275 [Nocardioides marinus]|nr:hypothetical protein [Nocardioides marinus]